MKDCAIKFGVDTIVRITHDCPFINTELISLTVRAFLASGGKGYLGCNKIEGLNVEVFDLKTLKEAAKHGPDEHVTTWMRRGGRGTDIPSLELNTLEDYKFLIKLL
jgi:spore coat polysaccharide biosynthesis protein SpsF (cytidylyltransferase family)